MKCNRFFIGMMIIFVSILGCATIKHTNVTKEDNGEGIRYYNSSPYLLAYSNGKGGIVTQILYIADPFKKMSVKPKALLANAQTTMEFSNGVYKTSTSTVDATVVPSAIIKAVEVAATALIAAANKPVDNSVAIPAPYLYKIIVDGNMVAFLGAQGDTPIKVNILEQDEKDKTKDLKNGADGQKTDAQKETDAAKQTNSSKQADTKKQKDAKKKTEVKPKI